MKTRYKIAISTTAILAAFWTAGYDFNERGPTALFAYFLCVMAATAIAVIE